MNIKPLQSVTPNPVRIEGDVAYLTVMREGLAHSILLDAQAVDAVLPYRWRLTKKGYATAHCWVEGRRTSVPMHRFLVSMEAITVDHVNGVRTDNRYCNLRVATRSQNSANQRKSRGKIPYKGVSLTSSGKYQAACSSLQGQIYLGSFDTPQAAALAYNRQALETWGQYARLNSISGGA